MMAAMKQVEWNKYWQEAPKRDRLERFENDRRAVLRVAKESEFDPYALPETLRFLATPMLCR
jgi:hypothetical protein